MVQMFMNRLLHIILSLFPNANILAYFTAINALFLEYYLKLFKWIYFLDLFMNIEISGS